MRYLVVLAALCPACNPQVSGALLDGGDHGQFDFAGAVGPDLLPSPGVDLLGADLVNPNAMINHCGDVGSGCMPTPFGPPAHPFPLQGDAQPDKNEQDNGVGRDPNGFLILSTTTSNFNYVWAANPADWNYGTVSKIDSKAVKEVARYFSVTCFSNPEGSRGDCDGTKGCCARDSFPEFANRAAGMGGGPRQQIQKMGVTNSPSRTAVDFNGDMWVANRAFGAQSSVTKIANDPKDCVDRNGAPGIQTSSDVNGDGLIETDCNGNNVPDDLADVMATPCANGKSQEFYGLDDDCILLTTNTNSINQYGRPLALGRGSVDFGPSDPWAGTFQDGKFFRIDGATGQTKAATQVPGHPYGAAIDSAGILWAPEAGTPKLYYFDTGAPQMVGTARTASFATDSYGVAVDRDNNVWMGGYPSGNALRYTPDRSNGFGKLGEGYWTRINNPGGAMGANDIGRGIAADNRSVNKYFVWMGRHPAYIVRIPASDIPVPMGMDVQVDGSNFAAIHVAGNSPAGAGVDTDQNIWAIATGGSVATRIKVDQAGSFVAPDIVNGQNGSGCPVGGPQGDRCALQLPGHPDPQPYTYSDFTGFGLRNFTNPRGTWTYVQKGCGMGDTKWMFVRWEGDQPAQTRITMRARTGPSPIPDNTWGAWIADQTTSPADLHAIGLMANPAPYLQVEVDLSTMDRTVTPALKSIEIDFECNNIPG